jgi:hypothetical protein
MSAKRRRTSQPKSPPIVPVEKLSATETIAEPVPTVKLPPPEEALALISQLQELRQSQVITFVTAPDVVIRGDVIEQLYEQLHAVGRVPQIDLFLHSTGGQTEIPWRLITLIREFCDRFAVLIPAVAYSAATHLAMGANEIVMGPLSVLFDASGQKNNGLHLRAIIESLRDPFPHWITQAISASR